MSSDLDRLLSSGESFVKKSGSYLLSNLGKLVAVLSALVAILIIFTDVSFSVENGERLTTTVIAMLCSSYVIFFSLYDSGERSAKETKEYKEAFSRFCETRKRISGDMLPALRTFIEEYTKEELKHRQNALLLSFGLNDVGYASYLAGEKCSRREKKAYRKAKRLKAVSLTPRMLLSFEKVSGGELSNPERHKTARIISKMIPTTICTLLTVSMALSLKDGLTARVVLEGILKLSTLPVVAFRGYVIGHSYVRGPLLAWQEAKRDILNAFLKTVS